MLKRKWTELSKKRKTTFFVFLVLSVAWMCVIYGFSADDAKASSKHSGKMTEKIVNIVDDEYKHPEVPKPDTFEYFAERTVRKTAHFMCYAVLATLCYFTFGALLGVPSKKMNVSAAGAFAVSVLYASFDEFHQTFVDGRFGSPIDVLIDAGGSLFGILACFFGCILYRKYARRNQKELCSETNN